MWLCLVVVAMEEISWTMKCGFLSECVYASFFFGAHTHTHAHVHTCTCTHMHMYTHTTYNLALVAKLQHITKSNILFLVANTELSQPNVVHCDVISMLHAPIRTNDNLYLTLISTN